MYLSKLALHGFKSFADRTALHFDPGTTAVVGPNGCGKSNIVDAVRWVIGEQRARVLRSEKMENVIFNGTSKRRPLGMAEVELTIENTHGVLPTEYTEVTLGRRLYRSGESEYLLNGVQCRLKDITDLFMDTGMGAGAYSVIELKMVDEILSENPHDQRRLFEEAAGITKYKLRRRQTLNKLDNTQADLTRLRDLTEEIEKRVRSLKRQADKAARYKKYRVRLRYLEQVLAQLEYERLVRRQESLEGELHTFRQQAEDDTQRMDDAERRLSELTQELARQEQAVAEAQQHLQAHLDAVRSLEAERQVWIERLDAARRDRERTLHQAEQDEARREALHETARRLEHDLEQARPHLDDAERHLKEARTERDRLQAAAAKQRERVQALRRQVQDAEDARADRRRALDRLASRLDVQTQERARVQAQQEQLAEDAAPLEAKVADMAARLAEAQDVAAQAQQAFDAATQEREAQQNAVQAATDALRQAERRYDAAEAEVHLLESLVASYEEFPDAIQFLATAAEGAGELLTVADVLACDASDRVALDAALGDLASCVVVPDEAAATAAAALLRAQGKGQATFLLLDRLAARNGRPVAPPSAARIDARPLREVVRLADPMYEPLAKVLLHGWFLAETLENAQTLAAASEAGRFVTPGGEWVDARGFLHGGSARSAPSPVAGRLGRREQLHQARADLARWEAERTDRTHALEAAREALAAVPFDARRTALRDAEMILTETRQAHTRAAYEQQNLQQRRQELSERLDTLAAAIDEARGQIQQLDTEVAEAEDLLDHQRAARTKAEEAFQEAESASRAALQAFSEAHVAAVQGRNHLDNLRRDQERTQQALQDLADRAEARTAHLAGLDQTLAEASRKQAGLTEQIDGAADERDARQRAVEAARGELMRVKQQIADVERGLREIRQAREQQMREENLRAVRLAEVKTRLSDLVENMAEEYEIDLTGTPIDVEDEIDEADARQEVQDLRRKVRSLGAVNELALEEYEEEKERFEFLTAQQEDLEQAEATLLETIEEINTTAAERFNETFDQIQQSFSRLFADLFGEDAAAELSLVDPDDPLESAIHIMARPRGKRPSTIAQLSGGEKTLTAIALLFAIYLVKPSPFCILDEVDAPLDDANVDRFMNLIRAFADRTQFILVTHNKRTMEMADRLYGVTMQEQGVSKLVAVQFDEAVALAEV